MSVYSCWCPKGHPRFSADIEGGRTVGCPLCGAAPMVMIDSSAGIEFDPFDQEFQTIARAGDVMQRTGHAVDHILVMADLSGQ